MYSDQVEIDIVYRISFSSLVQLVTKSSNPTSAVFRANPHLNRPHPCCILDPGQYLLFEPATYRLVAAARLFS